MAVFVGGPLDGIAVDGLAQLPEKIKLSVPIRFEGGGEAMYSLDGKAYRFAGWESGDGYPSMEDLWCGETSA